MDMFAGTRLENLIKPYYGEPEQSRVSPPGHTTHHDIDAYDEYTTKINPPKNVLDPNNPYQKVEVAMNHVDNRWGENYEEPFDIDQPNVRMKPPAPTSKNLVMNDRAHHIDHRPNHVVIDTPAMEQLTPNDVDEVFGYTDHNMKLLRVASVRVSNLTNVLNDIQSTDKGIDLVRIMEQVPFASVSFRAVLEEAFNVEMKNYLNIISKLNYYIYGNPPEEENEDNIDEGTNTDNDSKEEFTPVFENDPNDNQNDTELVDNDNNTIDDIETNIG